MRPMSIRRALTPLLVHPAAAAAWLVPAAWFALLFKALVGAHDYALESGCGNPMFSLELLAFISFPVLWGATLLGWWLVKRIIDAGTTPPSLFRYACLASPVMLAVLIAATCGLGAVGEPSFSLGHEVGDWAERRSPAARASQRARQCEQPPVAACPDLLSAVVEWPGLYPWEHASLGPAASRATDEVLLDVPTSRLRLLVATVDRSVYLAEISPTCEVTHAWLRGAPGFSTRVLRGQIIVTLHEDNTVGYLWDQPLSVAAEAGSLVIRDLPGHAPR
jgi:hypothetical protein